MTWALSQQDVPDRPGVSMQRVRCKVYMPHWGEDEGSKDHEKPILVPLPEHLILETQFRVEAEAALAREYGTMGGKTPWFGDRAAPPTVSKLVVSAEESDLDSNTIMSHLVAVGEWHDYVRQTFQRAYTDVIVHFPNPMHNEEVQEMLTAQGENFKKKSRARVALTIEQARDMFARGFKRTASGDHNKLAVIFSLLGMLRQKAATHLIIAYRIVVDDA